ncbi:MAG TPA: ATP-binding cassette domain-containing protein [Smithellaceae bacterium]|nr:ATP-binding cassette domain-containing protein [Smithellaceae bacterium]HRS89196.1 ATP-binding cassette domain-containing protein [Smithellaceae bacterium]HRV26120.1 ATP-binding cassette domain-containing protein [Smithellaceae bacterium]
MQKVLLEVKNLSKIYETVAALAGAKKRLIPALSNVDLQIYKGETLGLVGESGCGKSTLAKLITLLEKPSSGSILHEGQNIFSYGKKDLKSYRRRVQLVFQDPYSSLNARRSAAAIIEEPLIIQGQRDKQKRKQDVLKLMEQVGLTRQQANRYPHEFSGGQRQRIGIARALILRPELIVADEPVSALDVSIQAQILNLLKRLKNDFGLTYLFISHDLNVIRHMSDRVAVMYLGRIVELADNRDIYDNPLHPYTRLLLSAAPSYAVFDDKIMTRITGEAGTAPENGCSFQNRCAYKRESCSLLQPPLKEIAPGRYCACHWAGES